MASNSASPYRLEPSQICLECSQSPAKMCDKCQWMAFCSEDCKEASQIHKSQCTMIRMASKRPSAGHVRGMILAQDGALPQHLWLKVGPRVSSLGIPSGGTGVDVGSVLGRDMATLRQIIIDKSALTDKDLGHQVMIVHQESSASKPNKVIADLLDSQLPNHSWPGTMVLYRTDNEKESVQDFTYSDLMHVKHYLQVYGYDKHQVYSKSLGPVEVAVQGVKIACEGDQELIAQPKYSSIWISAQHPIFMHPDGVPPIGEKLGMALLTEQLGHDPKWPNFVSKGCGSSDNQSATFLHANTDPKHYMFGFAPIPKWQNDVGSIIIVRKDKKPLLPNQVEALADFCQFELPEVLQDYKENDMVEECEEEVLSFMTPKYFNTWWNGYRVGKLQSGNKDWQWEKCPIVDDDSIEARLMRELHI